MKEHLARFTMPNGEKVDMHKDESDITITTKDHRVIVPQATGQQTLDWCALFESLGTSVEYPEENDGSEES